MDKKIIKDLNYPRPLLKRDSYIDLNGMWDFSFGSQINDGDLPSFYQLQIKVPFCYQCEESGINISKREDVIYYKKEVTFDNEDNKRVIFHIDGSDYLTTVFVNGQYVGNHRGGYTPFQFDITDYLIDNKANIVIKCEDSYNVDQPRGKQKWKEQNFECWYQEVTGIWKSVWAEIVESVHIDSFKITPVEGGYFRVNMFLNSIFKGNIKTELYFKDKLLNTTEHSFDNKKEIEYLIPLKEIHYWDVDNPCLYKIVFHLSNGDVVNTIGGYRFLKTSNGKIYLNNKPLYMRLTLEQGYYKEGIYTFKNINQLLEKFNLIVQAGFNGLRMHQKVEDDRFYYLCDYYGLVVWSEMPSCYGFSSTMQNNLVSEWKEILKAHYNHPSILVWTPINESWGVKDIHTNKDQQRFVVDLYDLTKKYDATRLVVSNDGWEHCKTDLVTLHNYIQEPSRFKKEFTDRIIEIVTNNLPLYYDQNYRPFAEGYHYEGQPILVDEFCGIGFNIDSTNDGWGYGGVEKDQDVVLKRYEELIRIVNENKNIAGWCMTQSFDVYQEINGLFSLEMKPKFDLTKLKTINSKNN